MRCVTEWRDTDRDERESQRAGTRGPGLEAGSMERCSRELPELAPSRNDLVSFDLGDLIQSPKHLTEHHSETLSPCQLPCSIESCRVCPSAPPPPAESQSLSSAPPAPGPQSFKASCDSRRQLRCGRGHLRRPLHAGVRVQAGCAASSMASVMAAASRAWARAASQLTAATKQSCNARLRPDGVVLLAAHPPVVI